MPGQEDPQTKRNDFVWYIKQFLLKPYFYGGDDPMEGVDCSGLVVEGFKSIGEFTERQDKTANGFLIYFKNKIIQRSAIKPGCLVFWINRTGTRAGEATHVAILINKYQIIHAAGGGSSTDTLKEAIEKNAYVKLRGFEREIAARNTRQTYKIVDPFIKEESA